MSASANGKKGDGKKSDGKNDDGNDVVGDILKNMKPKMKDNSRQIINEMVRANRKLKARIEQLEAERQSLQKEVKQKETEKEHLRHLIREKSGKIECKTYKNKDGKRVTHLKPTIDAEETYEFQVKAVTAVLLSTGLMDYIIRELRQLEDPTDDPFEAPAFTRNAPYLQDVTDPESFIQNLESVVDYDKFNAKRRQLEEREKQLDIRAKELDLRESFLKGKFDMLKKSMADPVLVALKRQQDRLDELWDADWRADAEIEVNRILEGLMEEDQVEAPLTFQLSDDNDEDKLEIHTVEDESIWEEPYEGEMVGVDIREGVATLEGAATSGGADTRENESAFNELTDEEWNTMATEATTKRAVENSAAAAAGVEAAEETTSGKTAAKEKRPSNKAECDFLMNELKRIHVESKCREHVAEFIAPYVRDCVVRKSLGKDFKSLKEFLAPPRIICRICYHENPVHTNAECRQKCCGKRHCSKCFHTHPKAACYCDHTRRFLELLETRMKQGNSEAIGDTRDLVTE